jgi:hypothetical protein
MGGVDLQLEGGELGGFLLVAIEFSRLVWKLSARRKGIR